MPPTFAQLVSKYPTEGKEELFEKLGGEWSDLVKDPNYSNTCAVRMSIALQGSGYTIPDEYKEAITGDGAAIVLKVRTLSRLVKALYGPSDWGMSKDPGTEIETGTLPSRRGIIAYHADWSDATGHFDLWDTDKFIGNGNLSSIADGYSIEMWFIA